MKTYIESGDLVMLGVIQEQHAERCRLFQQWQGLEFPVVQDLLNTNGIAVVPIYVAIDEHGIVRALPQSPKSFADLFINQTFEVPKSPVDVVDGEFASTEFWKSLVQQEDTIQNQLGWADSLILWDATTSNVQQAIDLYTKAFKNEPERSDIPFRLGAANRLLYELGNQADADLFGASVHHWESALALNPNQYIYRRRIEQYGPRLSKPYSFYDWVATARHEIVARGEMPIEMAVEPNGAELAGRARAMDVDTSSENPDPKSQITKVKEGWVTSHVNFVPTHPKPGDVVAVHFGLNVLDPAKWNHESSPTVIWIDSTDHAIKVSSRLIRDETPHLESESSNPISISFEIQVPETVAKPVSISGFALFNICESEQGQCLFRRHEFEIEIPVSR